MGNYFIYIVTNPKRSVLYTGVTNDIRRRVSEHYENRGSKKTFAGRYYCHKLIYFERYDRPIDAIDREKEIKGWNRRKKTELIEKENPRWDFLDTEFL